MIDILALHEDVHETCAICGIGKSEHRIWLDGSSSGWTHDFRSETDLEYFLRRRKELLCRDADMKREKE